MRRRTRSLRGSLAFAAATVPPAIDAERRHFNKFVRTSGLFDGMVACDTLTLDPTTGELRAEYQPHASTGGPGDKLPPNRADYQAMGRAIDPRLTIGQ